MRDRPMSAEFKGATIRAGCQPINTKTQIFILTVVSPVIHSFIHGQVVGHEYVNGRMKQQLFL